MKRLLSAAAALALALTLTACGGGGGQEKPYETSAVQAMADAGAFSEELEELDADTAFALYGLADCGLSREDLTDCAVLRSAGATCEEGAVLVFSGEKQAGEAKKALDSYVSGQISANETYRPAEIPKLKSALVEQKSNSVLLVVAADLEAAQSALEG